MNLQLVLEDREWSSAMSDRMSIMERRKVGPSGLTGNSGFSPFFGCGGRAILSSCILSRHLRKDSITASFEYPKFLAILFCMTSIKTSSGAFISSPRINKY